MAMIEVGKFIQEHGLLVSTQDVGKLLVGKRKAISNKKRTFFIRNP